MAKKSRRQRRLMKEKEERRIKALANEGKPYSRHRVRVCCHYEAWGGMGIPVRSYSHLIQINENTYKCLGCGKIFTAEQAGRIDKLRYYLETAVPRSFSAVRELLTEDILPCKYYYTAPNEVVHCGTEYVTPSISGLWLG